MKGNARDNKGDVYSILCILAAAVTLFPLGCNYIMDGGIVAEWTARVAELAEGFRGGRLCLFPSLEARMASGIAENAMNSNLWFMLPGALYLLTGKMVLAYKGYMLSVQIGTFLAAFLCFRQIFHQGRMGMAGCVGVVLYMTNPYRIYVCYDAANLSQAAAWMLLPLYVRAVYGLAGPGGRHKCQCFLVAALALAGMGYADMVFSLTAAAVTVLAAIPARRPLLCAVVAAGYLSAFPGVLRLGRYLFTDAYAEWGIPLRRIMQNGYRVGQFFSCYAFRDGKPGMGLGMMLCLLTALWRRFVWGEKGTDRGKRGFAAIALFLTALSLSCFPWDILQRLGGWSVKLVSLIGTPAVFWGMATAAFCIPAADSIERISRCENKLTAHVVPIAVILFSAGICIYQCNTLTYGRLPMETGF